MHEDSAIVVLRNGYMGISVPPLFSCMPFRNSGSCYLMMKLQQGWRILLQLMIVLLNCVYVCQKML
jgi:lipoprotein signal peptidase